MKADKDKRIPFIIGATVVSAVIAVLASQFYAQISWIAPTFAGLTLGGLILYFVFDRAFYKALFARRTAKFGLNSALMSVFAFGILIVVNVIFYSHDTKWDFTKNRLHTLSDQSIKVLQSLDTDIKLTAFIYPNQQSDYDKIFSKYQYQTQKLTVAFIDPEKDPMAVTQHNIKEAGTILVESSTRSARIENLRDTEDPKAEQKITNAIIQVAKGDKKKAYFLVGHRERKLDNAAGDGYSGIKENLEEGRYEVAELNLAEHKGVPADAAVVICANPVGDFFPGELKTIESYVRGGGKFLMLVEPDTTLLAKGFLAGFGVEWEPKKAIVELNQLAQMGRGNPVVPVVSDYDRSHQITRDTDEISVFTVASPLTLASKAPDGLKLTALMKTSANSMQVPIQGNRISLQSEKKGPLAVGVAISGEAKNGAPVPEKKEGDAAMSKEDVKKNEFRMVVVGDSDFVSNGGMRMGVNSDLFQNMVAWLSHDEDLISIRPVATDDSKMEVTAPRMKVVTLASVVVAPLLMLVFGIGVWLTRRRK